MASREVSLWVRDSLHDILGISDHFIADYLIGLAGKASSGGDFVRRIQDTGTIDVNASVTKFAQELWEKVTVSPTTKNVLKINRNHK